MTDIPGHVLSPPLSWPGEWLDKRGMSRRVKRRATSLSRLVSIVPHKHKYRAQVKKGDSYLGHGVKLGAFYPLDLLPDHHGSFFQQSKAKLAQLDIKDIDMNSSHLEKLRPGTVLIQATLVCWIIKEKNKEKKIYQVNGHSVRVLAESTEAVEIPPIPILPATQGAAASGSGSNSPVKSTQAFTSVQSPSKKRKMDM